MHDDGVKVVKNCPKLRDVIYGRPQKQKSTAFKQQDWKVDIRRENWQKIFSNNYFVFVQKMREIFLVKT